MKFEMKNTNQQKQSVQKKAHRGFTLIELLISMTITLIIVGLLMGMTKMAVSAWQKTHAKTRSSRLAQEVFDSIGKDLEGMVIRSGNNYEWLLIKDVDSMEDDEMGPIGGPGADAEKQIVNPLEISFFSAVTDRYNGQINVSGVDMGGDISMVRYRLIHQDLIGGATPKPVFALYRERIDPDYTFHHALANKKTPITDPVVYSIDSDDLRDTPWTNRDMTERPIRDYTSAGIVEEQNYLAENIFDFTLSFNFEYTLVSGAKGYERVVIQANGDNESLSIKGNEILVNIQPDGTGESPLPTGASSPRLAGVDVSILVLSDGGMNGLKNKNITDDADFAKFLNEFGHHYSKSVIIPRP
jgi:prepilin-type N-terminal cleavage/methylation domain-containing protein